MVLQESPSLLLPVDADRLGMSFGPIPWQHWLIVSLASKQPFEQVVDIKEQNPGLRSPPATLPANIQFLRPIATCFISCSHSLLSIGKFLTMFYCQLFWVNSLAHRPASKTFANN